MRINLLQVLFFICILALSTLSHADTIETQLSRDKITYGETLTITFISSKHAIPSSPDFSQLQKDFLILDTNYGTAVNMINGVTTSKTFWRLTVEPKKPGIFLIPEMSFGDDKSITRQIVVEKPSNQIINDKNDEPTFIQASLSTLSPYVQSQIVYTFKLYYQSAITNPKLELPRIKDATFIELGEGSQYEAVMKGKPYHVVEKNFAIFPQKSGDMIIPSFYFRAFTYDTNSNLMFDPLSRVQSHPISLTTKSFTLLVKNVPKQFPGVTWLPAKNVSLTDKWSSDPGQWQSGNPVTRTITVEAQGLRADQIPDLSIEKIARLNIYVDPPKRSNQTQNDGVIGTYTQTVTYIPTVPGSYTIPELKLPWFNTIKNINAVAQIQKIAVNAIGKIEPIAPIPPNHSSISTSSPALNKIPNPPFYGSIWFWISVCFFVIWLITIGLIWRKKSVQNRHAPSISKDIDLTRPTVGQPSEKHFQQACEQANAALAQYFLLSWAKQQWQNAPLNLETLGEFLDDKHFKQEVNRLEQAIYAKNLEQWDGLALYAAFQTVNKQHKYKLSHSLKSKKTKKHPSDLLPPLNP